MMVACAAAATTWTTCRADAPSLLWRRLLAAPLRLLAAPLRLLAAPCPMTNAVACEQGAACRIRSANMARAAGGGMHSRAHAVICNAFCRRSSALDVADARPDRHPNADGHRSMATAYPAGPSPHPPRHVARWRVRCRDRGTRHRGSPRSAPVAGGDPQ